jgi:hypothetical protein
VAEEASIGEISAPQFCPWCGAPTAYRRDRHIPLWQRLARQSGAEAPEAFEASLHTHAFVTGCAGCRRLSHVIGHVADVEGV